MRFTTTPACALACAMSLGLACSADPDPESPGQSADALSKRHHDAGGGGNSDASTPPTATPIAEADTFTTLYAVSDLHGHLAEMTSLLARYALVAPEPAQPSSIVWTGGDATLVVVGDLIDKGPESLEVVEALMALQSSASKTGGTVLVLMGNHEAEFLASPTDTKAEGTGGIDLELGAQSPPVDPVAFASGADPRGAWVRQLPLGARVADWFFSHAGDTGGQTVAELDATLSAALASTTGFGSSTITGSSSLLESRGWYTPQVVSANASALGVKHIVFGHDPNAFGATGTMAAPAEYAGGLYKIDTGLGSGASSGALLRVRHTGAGDVAEMLLPDGSVQGL
jgi:hypothetical protein